MISVKDIVELLGIKLLGVIPEDISILLSSNEGKPISYRNKHPMYQFFIDIAKSLSGQKDLPSQDFAKSKTESLWKKVKRSFTMNR